MDPEGSGLASLRSRSHTDLLAHCDTWRISGLVYRRLVEPIQGRLPDELVHHFRNRYATNVRLNLKNAEAVSSIDEAFEEERIRALLVKGMALISCVYDDPGVRSMSDIDLVIWPEHEQRAIEILLGLGYTRDTGHPTVFTTGEVVVDLKPEPFGVARIQTRSDAFSEVLPALWETAEPLEPYKALKTWSMKGRVYALAVHALKHGFPDGIWLNDLGETMMRMTRQDWVKAADLFAKTDNDRVLSVALLRSTDWGYPMPEQAKVWQMRTPGSGSTKFLRRLSDRGQTHLVESLYLVTRPGSSRIKSLIESFFPNEAVFRTGLPGILNPFRYLIRVFDVLLMSVKSVLSKTQGV